VRSIRYSPDGHTLAVGEASDYVNLYDVDSAYARCAFLPFLQEQSDLYMTRQQPRSVMIAKGVLGKHARVSGFRV